MLAGSSKITGLANALQAMEERLEIINFKTGKYHQLIIHYIPKWPRTSIEPAMYSVTCSNYNKNFPIEGQNLEELLNKILDDLEAKIIIHD